MNEFKLIGKALCTPVLHHGLFGNITYTNVVLDVDGTTFEVMASEELAKEICGNLKKGDVFIVKGHLAKDMPESEDDSIELVADRMEYWKV